MTNPEIPALDIAAIQKRLAAATPGPWEWCNGAMVGDAVISQKDGLWLSNYVDDGAESVGGGLFRRRIIETDSGYYPPRAPDRDFIAHAPEDILVLLAEVARLTQQLAEARTGLRAGPPCGAP